MVSTGDFISPGPSSNLGGAYFTQTSIHFLKQFYDNKNMDPILTLGLFSIVGGGLFLFILSLFFSLFSCFNRMHW